MHPYRKAMVVTTLAALAATALAAPSAAIVGRGTIGVVNGIPGQRVDICIDNQEIRGNVRYGGRVVRTMFEGSKTVKVFKADPRPCKGVKLAQKVIDLTNLQDLTVVVNKQAPKVVVFDNTDLGAIGIPGTPYPGGFIAWRHAADLGDVSMKYLYAEPEKPIGPAPAADPVWREGDQIMEDVGEGTGLRLRATRPDADVTIAQSQFVTIEASRRYEWYLLGTKPKNAKFVVWSREVSQPPV